MNLCDDSVEQLAAGHQLQDHVDVAAAFVHIKQLDAMRMIY